MYVCDCAISTERVLFPLHPLNHFISVYVYTLELLAVIVLRNYSGQSKYTGIFVFVKWSCSLVKIGPCSMQRVECNASPRLSDDYSCLLFNHRFFSRNNCVEWAQKNLEITIIRPEWMCSLILQWIQIHVNTATERRVIPDSCENVFFSHSQYQTTIRIWLW